MKIPEYIRESEILDAEASVLNRREAYLKSASLPARVVEMRWRQLAKERKELARKYIELVDLLEE